MKKVQLLLFGVVLAALLALPGAAMAKARDRDHDKMPDKWEKRFGLSTHRNNAKGDRDHDRLSNLAEFRSHTNPRDADTNNDGVKDGDQPSGTVDSFVEDPANPGTGVLTIKLPDNSTISGKVTSDTEIECEDPNAPEEQGGRHERHGADGSSAPAPDESDGPNNDANEQNGDDDGPNHDVNEQNGDDDGDNGDDDGDNNDEHENDANCTTANLTPGAVVNEADLHISGGEAVFEKVELG